MLVERARYPLSEASRWECLLYCRAPHARVSLGTEPEIKIAHTLVFAFNESFERRGSVRIPFPLVAANFDRALCALAQEALGGLCRYVLPDDQIRMNIDATERVVNWATLLNHFHQPIDVLPR